MPGTLSASTPPWGTGLEKNPIKNLAPRRVILGSERGVGFALEKSRFPVRTKTPAAMLGQRGASVAKTPTTCTRTARRLVKNVKLNLANS